MHHHPTHWLVINPHISPAQRAAVLIQVLVRQHPDIGTRRTGEHQIKTVDKNVRLCWRTCPEDRRTRASTGLAVIKRDLEPINLLLTVVAQTGVHQSTSAADLNATGAAPSACSVDTYRSRCIHIGAVYGHGRRVMIVILIYFIHRENVRRTHSRVLQNESPEAVNTSAPAGADSPVNTTLAELL